MLVTFFAAFVVGCCTLPRADGQYVRLVNGSLSGREGRLEVYYNGVWGTVCDDSFADVDARVACYSLGYGYNGNTLGTRYGAGSGQIWLDEVGCNGNETWIGNCRHNSWGVHDCVHGEDVSIACSATTIRPTTTRTTSTTTRYGQQVRLAGSSSYQEGRLEVYYNNVWGTVCNDEFTDVDAKVACYSLGFGYIGYTLGNQYGAGSGQIWLDDVACTGYETWIGNCRHNGWGVNNCGHGEDVSIACITTTVRPTTTRTTSTTTRYGQQVRLAGSSSYQEGRLEVYYNNVWGTVCNDEFTDVDAKVACYSLGFGYIGHTLGTQYGAGSGQIWLDGVACTGYETWIGNCRHNGWGIHNCVHGEDVSIACYQSTTRQPPTSTEKQHDCDKHCPCTCNGYNGCFDGGSTVQMVDGRTTTMTGLQVGDRVLTVDLTTRQPVFAEVITFLHIDRNSSTEFIVIETKSGAKITLTPNHLIFTRDKEATDDTAPTEVFAGSIKEGDLVYLSEPEGPTTVDEVTKIVRMKLVNAGIYAPLTSTGTIVVDGILASCYGSFHSHHLSHAAMFPLRVQHSLKMSIIPGEQFDERGINWYAAALMKVAEYVVPQQSTWWWQ